jgi:hypothetical protein
VNRVDLLTSGRATIPASSMAEIVSAGGTFIGWHGAGDPDDRASRKAPGEGRIRNRAGGQPLSLASG